MYEYPSEKNEIIVAAQLIVASLLKRFPFLREDQPDLYRAAKIFLKAVRP